MILVYVAGKFSGPTRADVEENIASAVAMGIQVAKLGAFPVVPHANTAHPEYEKVQPYAFWIVGTLELLRRCDALITVPNWKESSGARGEVEAMASVLKRPVFHRLYELEKWLVVPSTDGLADTLPPPPETAETLPDMNAIAAEVHEIFVDASREAEATGRALDAASAKRARGNR